MNSLEDYQVDRPEVYRRIYKGLELTGTNRVNDLFVLRVCFAIFELPLCWGNCIRQFPQQRPSGPAPFLERVAGLGSRMGTTFFTSNFIPGDHSGRATPVPIPNTAVKPARANDSLTGESRSLPGVFLLSIPRDSTRDGSFREGDAG